MDVEELAKSPRRVTTDEGTVVERSVKEAIEAEAHVAAAEVGSDPLHGLRISRCKPAGPV
jgi:hypothetical protein